MVENRINKNISFFLTLMHGGYVGNRNIINGHTLYNALLCWSDINVNDVEKVSFGIPQNDPVSLKGSNKYYINTYEEPKISAYKEKSKKASRTILDNLEKGYEGFKIIRSVENTLTNPLFDFSPIPFEIIKTRRGSMIVHKIDYFIFYIIWKNELPNIEFRNMEMSVGSGRNNGFGLCNIERTYNTTLNDIIKNIPEENKYTAMNGVCGIYNHKKYGFGEYIVDTKNDGTKIMKLTTPLCMNSTFEKTTQYHALPNFIKHVQYTKSSYPIWDKGIKHDLQIIRSGKVFDLMEK